MQEYQVKISDLAFGGNGIGRIDGKVCFVPFTAPGDTVLVSIENEKKSHLFGRIKKLVEPSPVRVQPPCPHFGNCGGCDWQHISYPAQTEAKEVVFAETLKRFAGIPRERVLPIAQAPHCFGYRSRIQLKLRYASGKMNIGFYRTGTHFVIDIGDSCLIAHPALNSVLPELRKVMDQFPEPDKVPQLDLVTGETGDVIAIIHYIGSSPDKTAALLKVACAGIPQLKGVFLQQGRKQSLRKIYGIDNSTYSLPTGPEPDNQRMVLQVSAGAFSQVNYNQNERLSCLVRQSVCAAVEGRVLDAYCGNGNLSLPLSDKAREIVGIESYAPSIADAAANVAANNVSNARYFTADADGWIEKLVTAGERFDIVILDPPRTGAAGLVRSLPLLLPKRIVYVSCDPATLARDLSYLQKEYEVVTSTPVDMFPQTYHIESITVLDRK